MDARLEGGGEPPPTASDTRGQEASQQCLWGPRVTERPKLGGGASAIKVPELWRPPVCAVLPPRTLRAKQWRGKRVSGTVYTGAFLFPSTKLQGLFST